MQKKKVIHLLAILYAVLMLFLLFFRPGGTDGFSYQEHLKLHFNIVPFHTIRLFLHSLTPPLRRRLVLPAISNLVGNVLLFLPLGVFPPLLSSRCNKLWKVCLLAALLIAAVEILQMLLLVGTCDIDDLILNVLGAGIGYGLFKFVKKE